MKRSKLSQGLSPLNSRKSSLPPPPSGTTTTARNTGIRTSRTRDIHIAEALILLEVEKDSLDASPKIEHLLKGIPIWTYLEGSEEPEARSILNLRKRLNQKQAQMVPFEAFCIAAKIPTKKMFGIIAAEVAEQEGRAKQLMFHARHTEVVEATIDVALTGDGVADRRMLHQAAGFVPIPRNSITHIHGHQLIDNRNQTANIAVLPPVEDTVRRLGDRFNERMMEAKMLPAAIPPDDEDDDQDDEGDDDQE